MFFLSIGVQFSDYIVVLTVLTADLIEKQNAQKAGDYMHNTGAFPSSANVVWDDDYSTNSKGIESIQKRSGSEVIYDDEVELMDDGIGERSENLKKEKLNHVEHTFLITKI